MVHRTDAAGVLPTEEVHAASRAWNWYPDNAATVETEEYLLVRFPDWADRVLQVVRFQPRRPVAEVLAEVLAHASGTGLSELAFWVKLGSPESLEPMLAHLGGRLEETVDVLARDLRSGAPETTRVEGPHDLEMSWVADTETLRSSYEIFARVFGGEVPPDERLWFEAAQTADDNAAGRGGAVVACLDGEPVGSGGLSVVDGVARLWSGSVLPERRGRGVYRAMLGARLTYAVQHGCRMALVKGRVETSGPILRSVGFAAYGEERSYLLPLGRD